MQTLETKDLRGRSLCSFIVVEFVRLCNWVMCGQHFSVVFLLAGKLCKLCQQKAVKFSVAKNTSDFFIDMSMMFRTASGALPFFTTVDNDWCRYSPS
jgi:hypothetical protein